MHLGKERRDYWTRQRGDARSRAVPERWRRLTLSPRRDQSCRAWRRIGNLNQWATGSDASRQSAVKTTESRWKKVEDTLKLCYIPTHDNGIR